MLSSSTEFNHLQAQYTVLNIEYFDLHSGKLTSSPKIWNITFHLILTSLFKMLELTEYEIHTALFLIVAILNTWFYCKYFISNNFFVSMSQYIIYKTCNSFRLIFIHVVIMVCFFIYHVTWCYLNVKNDSKLLAGTFGNVDSEIYVLTAP